MVASGEAWVKFIPAFSINYIPAVTHSSIGNLTPVDYARKLIENEAQKTAGLTRGVVINMG